MKPESKFWQEVKKNITGISFTRLESWASAGVPDLLCYNKNGKFFTIELKVTKGNSIRFSPHQISFHIKHPKNSFILKKALGPLSIKLYEGSKILELHKREPCMHVAESWPKIQEYLVNVT
jgi:Holliday junction resolvase